MYIKQLWSSRHSVLKWIVTWGYCPYTILQVRETRLTEERSSQFHTELSDGAGIWIWEVQGQRPLIAYLHPPALVVNTKRFTKLEFSSGITCTGDIKEENVRSSHESEICTLY